MNKAALALLWAAVIWATACCCAQAKSYTIDRVDIVAQLFPDGSMQVAEARTYAFSGSFSFAYRDLPTTGPVAFGDFSVSEGGKPYRKSDSQDPGTYSVGRSADRIRVTWYYRARNETRTFDFRYRARGAVVRYEDAAVLYFKFLAEDWDLPQNNVTVTVVPPQGVSRDRVNEWVHGPLWAGSVIRENGTVVISCAHLPAGTYLEIRALYPPGAFPLAEAGSGTVRPGIMEEEARWAEEANLRRQDEARQRAEHDRRVEKGKWFVIGGCLIGFGLWTWIFTAFRHRPRVPRIPRLTSEIPAETPPALLDYLLNSRRVSTGGLVGTMLDLCRRGFVRLREERVQKKRIFGGTRLESDYYWDLDRKHLSEAAELADFERDLLTFIFDEVAQGADSISLEALKKARRKFAAFFRGWTKLVQADAERMQWFDKRSIGGFYRSLALGVAMIALGVPAGIYLDVWAVLPMVTGAVIVALSFMIPQRTEAGQALALKWKAVQKYLKKYEFRSADRSDLLANISNYLVYGVVLGLSTRIYEELAAYMPEGRQRTFVPWYVYPTGGRGGFSPAAFGQAFSAMVATTTSSMSTAAGTGGGASGGGGGGAGSGGGGAG